jgi:hypothetical protein
MMRILADPDPQHWYNLCEYDLRDYDLCEYDRREYDRREYNRREYNRREYNRREYDLRVEQGKQNIKLFEAYFCKISKICTVLPPVYRKIKLSTRLRHLSLRMGL